MWAQAQDYEREWWGDCSNTFGEELKQLIYAEKMGLKFHEAGGVPFIIDLEGKTVIDIGGGPVSLLLKAINGTRIVIDPCKYPDWVKQRYKECGIKYYGYPGEEVPDGMFVNVDMVFCYNVLQHTKDPEKIIKKAKQAKQIRMFEWVDAEVNAMHPHTFTQEQLEKWLGAKGTVEEFNGINGLFGRGFYGIF